MTQYLTYSLEILHWEPVVTREDLRNNPRSAFEETVSLVAWRSEFDPKTGLSNLYIDASFDTGRIGGGGSPVRFTLSLKRAEVHVNRDQTGALQFPAKLVARAPVVTATQKTNIESVREGEINGGISVSPRAFDANAGAKRRAAETAKKIVEVSEETSNILTSHRATEQGYAFALRPQLGDRLSGAAFDVGQKRMSIRYRAPDEKSYEAPEPRVEVRCRREDLIIENIEFSDPTKRGFFNLSKEKKLAVEQYIKSELEAIGFLVGDMNDSYSIMTLADVSPEIEASGND